MTEKYEELNRLIQERLDRGTTLVYTQTGYLRNDQPMILTVVSNRELMRLNQLVQEIDPHAFMIIGNVNEVRGRGFSQQKVYKKETIRKIKIRRIIQKIKPTDCARESASNEADSRMVQIVGFPDF